MRMQRKRSEKKKSFGLIIRDIRVSIQSNPARPPARRARAARSLRRIRRTLLMACSKNHGRRGSSERKRGEADSHRCHRWRGGRCLRSDGSCANRSGETHNPTATDDHLARGIFQIVITSQHIVCGTTSHGVANFSCHCPRGRCGITVERQCPNTFDRGRINSAQLCVL